MATYLKALKGIQIIIDNAVEVGGAESEGFIDQIKLINSESNDLSVDLEIAFRSILAAQIGQLPKKVTFDTDNPTIRLIKFTIDLALKSDEFSAVAARLPYLLIEDILESQTIQTAKSIWRIVESWTAQLTNEQLFSKGKFTMLKTCNSLLRKLSKSCDTEFCGRILLFLATIYPISERSALNVMGRVNTSNVTYFDDEATFQQNSALLQSIEESKTKDESKIDASKQEEGEEVEVKKGEAPKVDITYELYSKFWKLQAYFANDSKAFDEPKDYWKEFMDHAKVVTDLLQKTIGQAENIKKGNPLDTLQNLANSIEEKGGSKFLTSSQLFALQFKDPLFRQQISVELLFFCHYFKMKALPLVEGDKKKDFEKDISDLESKARLLLEIDANPTNKELYEVTMTILERETHWIKWKNSGCSVFERPPAELKVGDKRKIEDITVHNGTKTPGKNIISLSEKFTFDCKDENVQTVAQQLVSSMPDFEEQIQQYLDADDPDAGIEEEYHPKHNQLYCWRTRRLLAERNVSVFKVMPDGNLGKGLRKLKNLPEPVPIVKHDEDVDEDDMFADQQEQEQDQEQENTSVDEEYADQPTQKVVEEAEGKGGETIGQDQSDNHEVDAENATIMEVDDGQQ